MKPREIFSMHPNLADAFYTHVSKVNVPSSNERLSRGAFLLSLAEEARQSDAADVLMRCNRALNDFTHPDYPHLLEALYRSFQVAGEKVLSVPGKKPPTDHELANHALKTALGLFSNVPEGGSNESTYRRLLSMFEFFRSDSRRRRSVENFLRRLPAEEVGDRPQ